MSLVHTSRAFDLLSAVTSGDLRRADPHVASAILGAIDALRLGVSSDVTGWTRARFEIRMQEPDSWVEVDGMRWNPHNLGVHVWTTGAADVTHIPSGKRLGSFSSLGAAMDFAQVIDDLYDWNLSTLKDLPADVERLIRGHAKSQQVSSFTPRRVIR